jgi:hypothetical protein
MQPTNAKISYEIKVSVLPKYRLEATHQNTLSISPTLNIKEYLDQDTIYMIRKTPENC